MTAEAAKPRAKARKIFKKGNTYMCGLCGKAYGSIHEAETCLRSDAKIMLAEAGAQETAPKRYRCTICKRIHDSVDAARSCALDCRKKVEARMAAEERSLRASSIDEKLKMLENFAKDPAAREALKATQAQINSAPKVIGTFKPKTTAILAGENIKFQREKNMFRCLKCRQRYSSADDARQCYDGHGDGPVKASKPQSTDPRYSLDKNKFRCTKCERLYHLAADAINCWEGHTPQPVEKKKDDDKAYFRDGAKYVCRTCGKKYFTRNEVVACFEGTHPEMEGADSPTASSEQAVEAPPMPTINKKDDAEKFYRDGAKYVCRGCGKKYFSRDEVLNCFSTDGHDGNPSA